MKAFLTSLIVALVIFAGAYLIMSSKNRSGVSNTAVSTSVVDDAAEDTNVSTAPAVEQAEEAVTDAIETVTTESDIEAPVEAAEESVSGIVEDAAAEESMTQTVQDALNSAADSVIEDPAAMAKEALEDAGLEDAASSLTDDVTVNPEDVLRKTAGEVDPSTAVQKTLGSDIPTETDALDNLDQLDKLDELDGLDKLDNL